MDKLTGNVWQPFFILLLQTLSKDYTSLSKEDSSTSSSHKSITHIKDFGKMILQAVSKNKERQASPKRSLNSDYWKAKSFTKKMKGTANVRVETETYTAWLKCRALKGFWLKAPLQQMKSQLSCADNNKSTMAFSFPGKRRGSDMSLDVMCGWASPKYKHILRLKIQHSSSTSVNLT